MKVFEMDKECSSLKPLYLRESFKMIKKRKATSKMLMVFTLVILKMI